MDSGNIVCPVCTLYLRPGVALRAHLTSHSKQKVIDALVNLTNINNENKTLLNPSIDATSNTQPNNDNWTQSSGLSSMPTNHSFIYQQFMSTSSQPPPNVINVNPLAQQYITIPTVFSPQMMYQPYLYHQQQQVIMSAGSSIPLPPLIPKPCNVSSENEFDMVNTDFSTEMNDDVDLLKETSKPSSQLLTPVSHDDEEEEEIVQIDTKHLVDTGKTKVVEENDKKEELENEDDQEIDDFEDENLRSLSSNIDSNYLHVRTDLNKACQTHQVYQQCSNNLSVTEEENNDISLQTKDVLPINNVFDEQPTNIVESSDQVIDMNGMQLVLCKDFMGSQLISQVKDFECLNNGEERRVLMNIGGMDGGDPNTSADSNANVENLDEESISHESTNMSIRTDEHMPPRGELSGQESESAASDTVWSGIQNEGNTASSVSYDLFAGETWEGSDCSNLEMPPLQSRVPPHGQSNIDNDDVPTIVSITEPPLNFKCSLCGQGFKCSKERRTHQAEVHTSKTDNSKAVDNGKSSNTDANVIGSRIGNKKPVKKLIIKSKNTEIKSENNFDNIFTSKLETVNDKNQEDMENKRKSVIEPVKKNCETGKTEAKYRNCCVCNMIFDDNLSLRQHKKEVHGKSRTQHYKCDTCEKIFNNQIEFNEHLHIHPLECRLCGKTFYRRQNLQLHMKRHLGIKPFECEFCQKSFFTRQKLNEHKNIHTGETPIKCTMCTETFRRHSNLTQHRKRHHLNIKKKLKDYICFCGEVVSSKKKLAWHKEIHDEKPKACMQCSEKFIHMASLTRHIRRTHNDRFVPKEDRVTENVECPICKGVYLKSSLEAHIRNHSGDRPYTCAICNKTFTTNWNLKLHKWTHAARALKPFKCDQCQGAFIRQSDYISHMNSHKSVRPYTCNYCGAQFIRKYNCHRHVKEHEKEKTFECQVCGKSFHRSYYLKDHMRIHSGIRPFTCHICGKTSTSKSNHNKHVMIHHAKDPVSTEN